MELKYSISVVGQRVLEQSLTSIERSFRVHQQRLIGQQRQAGIGTRGAAAKPSDVARGFDQIGRAARAADLRAGREAMAIERRRHTEAMRNRQREARVMAQGFASIGKAARAEELRRHREAIRNAERASSRFGAGVLRGAGSGMRNVVGIGGGTLALAGGFGAVNAIREQMSATAAASNLANQAGRPELKGSLLKQMQSQRGISAEQAGAGASAFQAMAGDIEATQKVLPMLSQLSLATGANLEDLGAAAGSAFAQIRQDTPDTIEQMKRLADVMRLVAAQGQEGAIEIRDLGALMPRLAGTGGKFVGGKDKNLGTMAAFAQVAMERGGAGSAEQAVTGVEALTRQLGVKGADLEQMGVKVFARQGGKRTGLLDPTETIISTLKKTGGDIPKLSRIFGDEGMRGLEGFRKTFVGAGGGAKGETAVRDLFARFSKTMTAEDVGKRAVSRLADPDLQMMETTKKFNIAVSQQLMPVLTDRLIPAFAKLTPSVASAAELVAKLAESAGRHPWGAVATVIGASIAKEVAAAKIGGAIQRAFSGVRAPAAGGAPGAPVGGNMAAAATGLTLGAVAAVTIYASGVSLFDQSERDMARGGKDVNAARASSDIGFVESLLAEAKSRRRTLGEEKTSHEGIFGRATDFVTGRGEQRNVEIKTQEGYVKAIEARLATLEAAANKMAGAADAAREGALAMKNAAGASNRNEPIAKR